MKQDITSNHIKPNVILNLVQSLIQKTKSNYIQSDMQKKNGKIGLAILILFTTSCTKFVEIDPPATDLIKSTVFTDESTATAAIIDVYAQMINGISYSNGTITSSLSYRAGLSADELDLYSTNAEHIEFATNTILPTTSVINSSFWAAPYKHIFQANAILEGLPNSEKLTPALKSRLEGEAKFLRAYAYFHLVNMFGDVPLIKTTDYRINSNIPRTSKSEVYQQIITDLKDAQNLLDSNYRAPNNTITSERARVNKFAATALLARTYLYLKDWPNAETQASAIINYTALYELQPLKDVFIKNKKEAIWQLSRDNGNAPDAGAFIFTTVPNNGALKNSLVTSFEANDQRKVNWIGSRVSGVNTYYFPNKYKLTSLTPIDEYSMMLRLAEQYLIRAEARINQPGKIADGIADLNVLRSRASLPAPNNLPPLLTVLSKEQAIVALELERQHELFTELGHRWFDLKRWPSILTPGDNTLSRADDVLKPLKAGWTKEDKLYPIPQVQINNDPAMANQQNPGYN
ncbi:RagB/SusD family nutrient uptake outer membrane protein [Chitinophaga niabensis]|uniref:SusD family protein n=1 Tax=Chitinophaga niabensis TaxID=536979 RepID=A0A1N6KAZ6_9BACT|nr:RagB/SusD family nutrient uptake outer membrane protein [Chitinophaga niabensis]SIO53728.1 SusD family protein [Chitinophaga niabensis]